MMKLHVLLLFQNQLFNIPMLVSSELPFVARFGYCPLIPALLSFSFQWRYSSYFGTSLYFCLVEFWVKSGFRSVNTGKVTQRKTCGMDMLLLSSLPFVIVMNRFQVIECSSLLYERLVMKRCKGCMFWSLCGHSVDHPVILKVNAFYSFVPYFHWLYSCYFCC